jgi:hypothetical protein
LDHLKLPGWLGALEFSGWLGALEFPGWLGPLKLPGFFRSLQFPRWLGLPKLPEQFGSLPWITTILWAVRPSVCPWMVETTVCNSLTGWTSIIA